MEILKNFGLDPVLLVAQIINFLIVLYVLHRFALKPILSVLRKREETIKEGLEQAEKSRILYEKSQEEQKKIIKDAQAQAQRIIEDAKQEAKELSTHIQEDTKKQVENMLITAREKIEQESKDAEKRLAVNVSRLAIDFLDKSIKELFGEKEQKEIMTLAINKFKDIN